MTLKSKLADLRNTTSGVTGHTLPKLSTRKASLATFRTVAQLALASNVLNTNMPGTKGRRGK